MTPQASVRVENLTSALPVPEMWGAFTVNSTEGNRLEVLGWALGAKAEVERIEVLAKDVVVASTEPSLTRKELAEQFPDRESARNCGFRIEIEAQGKGKSTLQLRAVLEDEITVPMGQISVVAPARRWGNVLRRT